jgi:hypothetical protein
MKLALLPPNQIVRNLSTRRNLKKQKKEKSFQDCPKSLKEQKQKKKSLK